MVDGWCSGEEPNPADNLGLSCFPTLRSCNFAFLLYSSCLAFNNPRAGQLGRLLPNQNLPLDVILQNPAGAGTFPPIRASSPYSAIPQPGLLGRTEGMMGGQGALGSSNTGKTSSHFFKYTAAADCHVPHVTACVTHGEFGASTGFRQGLDRYKSNHPASDKQPVSCFSKRCFLLEEEFTDNLLCLICISVSTASLTDTNRPCASSTEVSLWHSRCPITFPALCAYWRVLLVFCVHLGVLPVSLCAPAQP